jgi:hypothetical protein
VADLAVGAGASSVAHGVHFAVLGIGLLGLVWLLAPGRRAPGRTRDEHALRVEALRQLVAAGALDPPHQPSTRTSVTRHLPPVAARSTLPVAVVSCAAAAGVHAAVGPAHFHEGPAIGLFFVLAAVGQLVWSAALVMRPDARLLRVGVLGNAALVALWAVTRTVGLPGLASESVGPWDLACVAWEVVAAVCCVRVLLDQAAGPDARVADWVDWDNRARLWAWFSAVGLGLLSISGAGS